MGLVQFFASVVLNKSCCYCCLESVMLIMMYMSVGRDSKALKDENLPPVICQDVENLQ